MQKVYKITLTLVILLSPILLAGKVLAADSSSSQVITLAVNESTTFDGPDAYTPSAVASGSAFAAAATNMSYDTNAHNYDIKVRANVLPTNASTDTIDWTSSPGTVTAPVAMAAAGTEASGFSLSNAASVNDDVAAKWNNGVNYAEPPTSETTVYSSTAAEISGNTWSVWWDGSTASTTEAGSYTATVTWTFSTTL